MDTMELIKVSLGMLTLLREWQRDDPGGVRADVLGAAHELVIHELRRRKPLSGLERKTLGLPSTTVRQRKHVVMTERRAYSKPQLTLLDAPKKA